MRQALHEIEQTTIPLLFFVFWVCVWGKVLSQPNPNTHQKQTRKDKQKLWALDLSNHI
jgi:hypothetical protein